MEREDRVIYTSHYKNITFVHLVFFFFSIKSDDAKIQNKQKHSKTTDTFLKIPTNCTTFLCIFCCITPGLIWRRQSGAVIDSGNADRHPKLRSRYRYLCMNYGCIFPEAFKTVSIQGRQGVLKALKCQNVMKINLHLVPDIFFFPVKYFIFYTSLFSLVEEWLY